VQIEVSQGTDADIDGLESLWRAMLDHHRSVTAEQWPVRPPDESWRRRRQQYKKWLQDGSGLLFLAHAAEDGSPVGYLMCMLVESGPTFDLGPEYAGVESLSVSPDARGAGVGTKLLEACQATLRERGVAYWAIDFLADNDGAGRLYERLGFMPWRHTLLAPVEP
jgi:ribosomal protein S18 acetylase RimI-like enzyme